MRKIILFGWLLPLLLLISGCQNNEDDTPLESVFQTQWRGTFTGKNMVQDVILVFDYPDTGYFLIDGIPYYPYGIEYYQNEKMLRIKYVGTDYDPGSGSILNGDWTITELTQSRLELVKDPFDASQKCVLNLRYVKL